MKIQSAWKVVCIAALVLSLCVVCFAQGGVAHNDALSAARAVVQELASGAFDQVEARFNEAMRAQVDAQMIKSVWDAQVEALGAYVEPSAEQAMEQDGAVYTTTELVHEGGSQTLTLIFDKDGALSGMFLRTSASNELELRAGEIAPPLPEGAREWAVTLFPGTERNLTGAIVLPAAPTAGIPAALLVQGSGASDLDETIGPNKPFRDIAYGLAARGIASIRFDKLPYAHPELFAGAFTVKEEYLEPVVEALRVLKEQVDAGKIYLVGHSQGGMLTPYLMDGAGEDGFAGGVILAGSPRQLWQIQVDQNMQVIESMTGAERDAALAMVEAEVQKAEALKGMTEAEAEGVTIFGIPGLYTRHMSAQDEIALAKRNGKPLLILRGEADFQVSDVDFEAWKQGLGEDGLATYKLYPGLSHLFMTAVPGTGIHNAMEAYAQPDVVSGVVIDDIAQWIQGQ